jgi:hypothetical protein
MLALSVVAEIRRLAQEGKLSQRKIAARLGVSRGIVSAIASGRRPLFGKTPAAEHSDDGPGLIPRRCPACGFLVTMPCLVCRTRGYRQSRQILRDAAFVGPAAAIRPRRRPARRGLNACYVRVA